MCHASLRSCNACVIKFTAMRKRLREQGLLSFAWIDSIAECFSCYYALSHRWLSSYAIGYGEAQVSIASADLSRHYYNTKYLRKYKDSYPSITPRFIPQLKQGDFSLRRVKECPSFLSDNSEDTFSCNLHPLLLLVNRTSLMKYL